MGRTTAAWLLVAAPVVQCPVQAQVVIQGVVIDRSTEMGVVDAAVLWQEDLEVRSATTDASGRFALEVSGKGPWQVRVERFGYASATVTVEPTSIVGVRIFLDEAPVELAGLDVEADRSRTSSRFLGLLVTDRGLVTPGRPEYGCYYMMMDSVVIRDHRLLTDDVLSNPRYDKAHLWSRGYLAAGALMRKDVTEDLRLRRDAWPCGVIWIENARYLHLFRKIPDPPTPEGVPTDLVAEARIVLPELSDCVGSLVVGAAGRVAAVGRDQEQVVVLSAEGEIQRTLEHPPRSGSAPCHLRVGWRGDTLWVADASRLRLTRYPPGGEGRAETARGVPGTPTWDLPDRSLPSVPAAMDLPVPVPVEGARWLWTWPAPDPPSPPLHPDDPPGRLLVRLDDDWALERVLTMLHPGAAVVDAVFGPEPLLGEQPFGDHPLYRIDPGGRHVTLVQREHQMAAWMTVYRVTRLGLLGDTIFHVERRAVMEPVTDEAFDATAAELTARPGAAAAFPGTQTGRRALVRGMLYRPPYHAPISDLLVGLDGTTWLRWPDTRDGSVRWEILDQTAQPVRTLEMPGHMELLTADGLQAWARAPGEGGAPDQLVRFRLRNRTASGGTR